MDKHHTVDSPAIKISLSDVVYRYCATCHEPPVINSTESMSMILVTTVTLFLNFDRNP